jgi:hypothetical protein
VTPAGVKTKAAKGGNRPVTSNPSALAVRSIKAGHTTLISDGLERTTNLRDIITIIVNICNIIGYLNVDYI